MFAAIEDKLKDGATYLDVAVAFLVVAILAMIIIPLPAGILDFMLVLNISLSVTILLLTLFSKNVLEFSTFPTLLLIMTMFRLALNVSSTRLILSEGDAGDVIDTFGNLVAGNNFIVGAVIFIIIIIIQMMVVTNGSSRVSEVTARFTLDAMPGKQMAIDADLNAGLINELQAKKRRADLERESQFYGAMDGASKFVKGDAIAGIIITVINLVGGILIYVTQNNMALMDVLDKFGKLSIGDGLVTQVPALMISVASGILVTRSANEKSFGSSLAGELFTTPKVVLMVSFVLILFAFVPGFPTLPFLILGLAAGTGGYLLLENEKKQGVVKKASMMKSQAAKRSEKEKTEEESISAFQVDPISIEIGYGLIPMTDESKEDNLTNHIGLIRRQCAAELGILLTPIRIRDNLQLNPNEYVIKIKGNENAKGELYLDKYMVIDPGETEFEFDGIPAKEPAFGLDAMWINEGEQEVADLKGYTVVEPFTVLDTHLKEVITKHSHELLGRQEVQHLLEGIKERNSVVIDELIPDILRLGEVQKVLQNLLKEGIPINDLATILETLADHGNTTKDAETLTEYVRQNLKQTIVKPYRDEQGILHVATILPDTEELISRSIQKSSAGSIPVLQPDTINKLFDNLTKLNQQLSFSGVTYVLLASPKVRPAIKNLISFNFPDVAVLSLNEVPNEVGIETVGMIE